MAHINGGSISAEQVARLSASGRQKISQGKPLSAEEQFALSVSQQATENVEASLPVTVTIFQEFQINAAMSAEGPVIQVIVPYSRELLAFPINEVAGKRVYDQLGIIFSKLPSAS